MYPASSHRTSYTVKLAVYVVTVVYVKIMAISGVTPVDGYGTIR